jgi:4-amino-4-deoxychorismate lyase
VRSLLINGIAAKDLAHAPTHVIDASDRGLNYGDGLFETMGLRQGRVRFLDEHLERLALGCARLGIAYPGTQLLSNEIASVVGSTREGVVKIVVTRGRGGRGYRPSADTVPTRIVALHDAPNASNVTSDGDGIRVRWCELRLSRNPALAGIKHLNRLEQVLAQKEWSDAQIEEGLMLDYEGELVCGTASNLFLVRSGELVTPDLRYCGVRGVMRGAVIAAAKQLGITVHEEPLWPDNIATATEVFMTNAVRGIRFVAVLDEITWPRGSVTQALSNAIEAHA